MIPEPIIAVARVTPQKFSLFRDTRLCALQDVPSAFGATYAKESLLTDADWIERTIRWNGDRGIGILALNQDAACGLAGSFLQENDATRAHLVSMWTAPTHRRQGVGRSLVDAVVNWARQRGAHVLFLMVTSSNEAAIHFYERLGFTRTGRTEPYPNDPALFEYEMSKALR